MGFPKSVNGLWIEETFFLDFNKNGLPLPLPLSFPLPSQTLQFWEIVS